MEENFLNKLVGKKVRIVQIDSFTKDGVLEGFDDRFLFLRFSDGSISLIQIDKIIEIKGVDNEKESTNR